MRVYIYENHLNGGRYVSTEELERIIKAELKKEQAKKGMRNA